MKFKPSQIKDGLVILETCTGNERGMLKLQEGTVIRPLPIFSCYMSDIQSVGCFMSDTRYIGIRMTDSALCLPSVQVFLFDCSSYAASFLAVLRDKFGVSIDEGAFHSGFRSQQSQIVQRSPSCINAVKSVPQQGKANKRSFSGLFRSSKS